VSNGLPLASLRGSVVCRLRGQSSRVLGSVHPGFFFFFRAQGLYLEPLHECFFVMGVFEIGSCELFTPAGLEPRSS
jgi:hypothetical protein